MTKICNKCNIEKNITEFNKNKRIKDGYFNTCKKCRKIQRKKNEKKVKEYAKKYYQKNKEEINKQYKEYYKENKEKIKNQKNKYRENNREKINKYRENNREELNEKNKEYYQKNKGRIKNQKKEYLKNKFKTDINFKFWKNIRKQIKRFFKSNNIKKNSSTKKLLEWNFKEYKEIIESNSKYTFDDYLKQKTKLHLDHIIPQSLYSIDEIKKCYNPRNLRIIEAEKNILKSNILDIELIEEYKIKDLLPINLEGE